MKINAENILKEMISLLTSYLKDLSDISDSPETQFAYGEKTAYTECLELLSKWEQAEKNGLNFDVEQRFPL